MIKLYVVLQSLLYALLRTIDAPRRSRTRRSTYDENGSVTLDHVLWAVGVLAMAGGVVAALKLFVLNQAANLK